MSTDQIRHVYAISVRQPWAWAIMNAGKQIENRSQPDPWRQRVGQRIYIHASKGCTREEYEDGADAIEDATGITLGRNRAVRPPSLVNLPRGAIVGTAYLSGVFNLELGAYGSKVTTGESFDVRVREVRSSPWTIGPWCLLLRDVRPLTPMNEALPWKGSLGWFPGPPDAEAAIRAWSEVPDAE